MLNIQLTFNTTQLVFQRFNCLKKKTHLINCFIFWIQIHLLNYHRFYNQFFTFNNIHLYTHNVIFFETTKQHKKQLFYYIHITLHLLSSIPLNNNNVLYTTSIHMYWTLYKLDFIWNANHGKPHVNTSNKNHWLFLRSVIYISLKFYHHSFISIENKYDFNV